MSADANFTAASGAPTQKNGGTPEGARQRKVSMLQVPEKVAARKVAQDIPDAASTVMSDNRKLAIQLDKTVEEAKKSGKPSARMIELTPTLASLLLDRNPANRKINQTMVERYAYEITGGRWVFNGEPIIVSDTGELNDGQHRCAAVVEAGKPISVLMIVGVPRETRTTLDQGKTRTIGDYLSMDGHGSANFLGAAANVIWQVKTRGMYVRGGRSNATKGEIMELVANNPGIERSLATVDSRYASAVGGKTVLAAAHFLISQVGRRDDADRFFIYLLDGAGLKAGDPILYVRNRLINERGRIKADEKLELIFKAWNAWRRGERVSRMLLVGGVLPVLEA